MPSKAITEQIDQQVFFAAQLELLILVPPQVPRSGIIDAGRHSFKLPIHIAPFKHRAHARWVFPQKRNLICPLFWKLFVFIFNSVNLRLFADVFSLPVICPFSSILVLRLTQFAFCLLFYPLLFYHKTIRLRRIMKTTSCPLVAGGQSCGVKQHVKWRPLFGC